jgi:hypothetical protein
VALVSICNVFYIILTSICLLGRRVWKPNFFSSKFRIVFVARKRMLFLPMLYSKQEVSYM